MNLTEARHHLHEFLRHCFGEDLIDSSLGQIVVDESTTGTYPNAFGFSVNSARYFETRSPLDGLMSGAVVVPRDGARVHWAPTAVAFREYVEGVADGSRRWIIQSQEREYWGIVDPIDTERKILGVIRRLYIENDPVDEAFTRNLIWERTEIQSLQKLGHDDYDLVSMTEASASSFVVRMRQKPRQQ